MVNENEANEKWDYNNPDCYECGSNKFIQRVVHDRKRMITEKGIIKIDHPTDSPFEEVLFTVCDNCGEMMHKEPIGDGYSISKAIQELKAKLNGKNEPEK